MDDGRCAFIKSDGETCGGYAVRNSIYCFTHDPQSRKKRDAARAAGGKAAVKAKERTKLVSEVVAVAQVLPMFPPAEGEPELDSFEGLRTFAVSQVSKLRLDVDRGSRRGEELRRWMNFLLDLSKAESALSSKDRGQYGGDGRAANTPEPDTLAWLRRIARGPAGGLEGSEAI